MMKRLILTTLVLMLLISTALIGCEKESNDVSSPGTTTTTTTTAPDVTPDSPEDPVQITTPYTTSDLDKIIMCDIVEGVCVDVSRNTKLVALLSTVTYSDTKELRDEAATTKYTLSFGEILLTVYSDYSIGFMGTSIDVNARIVTSDNDFKYLDSIVTGEVLGFGGYNADQSIEIYNATGAKAKLADKADFIAKLNQIQYYQTAAKSDYDTSKYLYKIIIGGDDIRVYDNMFTVGDNIYLITAGNFDFLKLLSFESSSGELPWL
ncbi:MAG: hypothetical protein J6V42_01500 [Clostridia bacterium]|nr:hypothetical protein [Clostridia bacterium]